MQRGIGAVGGEGVGTGGVADGPERRDLRHASEGIRSRGRAAPLPCGRTAERRHDVASGADRLPPVA